MTTHHGSNRGPTGIGPSSRHGPHTRKRIRQIIGTAHAMIDGIFAGTMGLTLEQPELLQQR